MYVELSPGIKVLPRVSVRSIGVNSSLGGTYYLNGRV
jgi:hypothetical protein